MKTQKSLKPDVFAVILAGGSGTRLWPLSRETWPKQLLALTGKYTLLQETCRRTLGVVPAERQIIITNSEYAIHVQGQMTEIFSDKIPRVLAEPLARNTAPAILWAASLARKEGGDGAVLVVLPSDHLIFNENNYQEQLTLAVEHAAKGNLGTFGIKPSHPETGYGYIEAGSQQGKSGFMSVKRFVEKPDKEKAAAYIKAGNFTWNSGMFVFHVGTLLAEVKKFCPDLFRAFSKVDPTRPESVKKAFEMAPSLSIDYAVMEKTGKASVIPASFGWSDVGSWKSLFENSEKDQCGNFIVGDHIAIDTKNSLLYGKNRTISTIGISDLAVIDTPDALMVCPLDQTQRVKEIVSKLKTEHRREFSESTTVHRSWGTYTILEQGPRYKIKRIVVNPGKKLSLQRHMHRSEHWVVVRGTAVVKNADQEIILRENHSTYIQAGQLHRLMNQGRIPLQIIEIQVGSYLEEDDIERFDSDSKHSKKSKARK